MIEYDTTKKRRRVRLEVSDGTRFLGRVFLFMFAGLLITAFIGLAAGSFFTFVWPRPENPVLTYVIMSFAGLSQFILMLWIQFGMLRRGRASVTPFILYAAVMGIFLASFACLGGFGFYAAVLAFGVTAVVFGLLALIGSLAKRDLHALAFVGSGILIGSLLLIPFNFLLMYFFPGEAWWISWIISFVIFIAIMLITIWDVWQIKRIAASGGASDDLALYFAFNLYIDFIMIFLRLAQFIGIFTRRSN